MRIPKDLVTKYYNGICFLVNTDNNFVWEVKPRKAWLQSFEYKINSNVVNANIDALLKEEIDVQAKTSGRYEYAKERMNVNIKKSSKEKKKKKKIEDLEAKLGTLGKGKKQGN